MFTKKQKIIILAIIFVLLILISALIGIKQADPRPDYALNQPAEKAVLEPQQGREVDSFDPSLEESDSFNNPVNDKQIKNKPPKNTFWLGPKFNKLTGIGADEIKGFSMLYIPPDYAKRILGGDGTSQPVPIIIQTRSPAKATMDGITEEFTPSNTITVEGRKIQLYSFDTVAFIPFYNINRVAVVQSYSKQLLKKAISELTVAN
jgi:hypothetical protein